MNKNIQEVSEIELKSIAYDIISQLQLLQNQLNAINSELVRRNQEKDKINPNEPEKSDLGTVSTV